VKIATLSTLLSVVSLAAVAVLAVQVNDLADEIELARASRPTSDRTASDESRDLTYRDLGYRKPPREVSSESSNSDQVPASSSSSSSSEDEVQQGTVEERIAKIERDLKRQRSHPMPVFRGPRHVRNVDDLSEHLKLTRSQRDRVEDSIRRGRERVDAIMSVPGADGVSPKQAQEARQKKLFEALAAPDKDDATILKLAMGGRRKLNEKVPGSNETYRQQIQRIKQETRSEVNSGLGAEQQEAFKDTNIDSLVGGGASSSVSFFATSEDSDGGGEGATGGFVVETNDAVSIEVEAEDE